MKAYRQKGMLSIQYPRSGGEIEVKMENKAKDVQDYLEKKGIIVTETSIVNMAINIAERLGAGKYTFVAEVELEQRVRTKK